MAYKFRKRIVIVLQSNNLPRMQQIASKYFSTKLYESENNPEDKDNYVAINTEVKNR